MMRCTTAAAVCFQQIVLLCVVEDYSFTVLRAPKDIQRGVSHDRTGTHVAVGTEGACDVSHSQQEL